MLDLGDIEGTPGEGDAQIQPGHHSLHPEAVRNEVGNPDLAPGGLREPAPEASEIQILAFPFLPAIYEGFVKGKWKTSLKRGNPFFRLQESESYYRAYEAYINSIFGRPQTLLRVAALSDNLDIALGWSVCTQRTVHYVYIAKDFRGLGITRKLIPFEPEKITHLTIVGRSLWRKKAPKAAFDMWG